MRIDVKIPKLKFWHRKVNTPNILQMDAMESGAVCLNIILSYYGKYLPAEKVREACGVTRDGAKSINIIKAARNFGMDAEGVYIDSIEDLSHRKAPYIIGWKASQFAVVDELQILKINSFLHH